MGALRLLCRIQAIEDENDDDEGRFGGESRWLLRNRNRIAGLFGLPDAFYNWAEFHGVLPTVRQAVEVVSAAGRTHFRYHKNFSLRLAVSIEPERKGVGD